MFTSQFEGAVFWGIVILLAATAFTWIALNHRNRGKRRQDSLPLIFVVGVIGVAIGYARIGALPHWLFYPGEALLVAGPALTIWSYSILGRYLSPYVQVLPDHRLVEKGPYGYIRHPGYVGAMLACIGLGLALQSWVALLEIVTFGGILLAYRMHLEETFMVCELGDVYVEYMRKTKRFVPFVI